MIAQSKSVPLKVVANGVASTGEARRGLRRRRREADSPIKSAKDLAGKKVAVNTLKNIGDTTVRESVGKAGGDPTTSSSSSCRSPTCRPRSQAGQVDAAWVVEPFVTIAKAQGARVDRLALRRRRAEPHGRGVLHLERAHAAEPRPGQAVHRGDGGVARVRRGAPGRGPRRSSPTYTKIDAGRRGRS